MKIVIDIDNEHYERIMRIEEGVTIYPTTLALYEAVKNGTPLEAQQPEECEENGSPWCLGHCSYRNTPQCPYEDTIHREEVLKIIDNLNDLSYRWNIAKNLINKLPPATPQRPKGKWIEVLTKDGCYYECSECGQRLNWVDENDHYCCRCGSRNDEGL
jgi:hypothetical protein